MGKIIRNGISYGGSSSSAGNISYDNTSSGLASMTVQNAITELKDIVDSTDIIYQSFNVATTAWVANTDSSTSFDYPYIATITTNSYGDNDFPVWQLTGAGDVPTTAERVEIAKVIEAVFTSAGITLYANALVTFALVLQVAGCGANADGLSRTLLYTTGDITQGAPYQTDVSLLDNLNNYDMIMVLYPADTSTGRECCDTRIYDVSELLTSGYHAYYAGYMGRWCMVHFTNTTFNQIDRGSSTEGDQYAPQIYKIYGYKFNITIEQAPAPVSEEKKERYSTREQKTNKVWFNSKPIYQKTFSNSSGYDDGDIICNLQDLQIETLIKVEALGTEKGVSAWTIEADNVNSIYIDRTETPYTIKYSYTGSGAGNASKVTLWYTKTSDPITYTVPENSVGAAISITAGPLSQWQIERSDSAMIISGMDSSNEIINCNPGTVITVTGDTTGVEFNPLLPVIATYTATGTELNIGMWILDTSEQGKHWEMYVENDYSHDGYTKTTVSYGYTPSFAGEVYTIRGEAGVVGEIRITQGS